MNQQRRDTVAAAQDRLSKAGIRATRARRAVLDALEGGSGPRTADELHRLLPDIPLSSLYRTLSVLAAGGVLQRVHDGSGTARYELAEWLTGHHHHITCLDCGVTEDIDFSSGDEARINAIAEAVGTSHGYAVENHRLDLEGLCRSCR